MNSYESINEALKKLCDEQNLSSTYNLDQPEDATHGDYATNIAFILSKVVGKSPKETAESLVLNFQKNLAFCIEKVEVAGPGFINFFLKDEVRTQEVAVLAKEGVQKTDKKESVLLEYTDPNCFKVFHIGHLMSNAIGEATARLYEAAGYSVMRVCYPSDIGRNVAMGVWGVMKKESEKPSADATLKEKVEFLGMCYAYANNAFETDEKAKEEIIEVNKAIYAGTDAEVMAVYKEGRDISLEYFEILYGKLGTKFDAYIYESEVADPGLSIVQAHMGTLFEISDGATVYKGEQDGLHTRVFVNSAGLPTYETKDLGNYEKKLALLPNAYRYVVITASEQNEYFKVINKVEEKIHKELVGKLIHIGHGMMRLPSGKMSSRTGNVIGGEDLLIQIKEALTPKLADMRVDDSEREKLLNDIAVGAIKFSILRQAPGRDIAFDFDTSISFEGDSGPYLQYTHARTCALLEKGKQFLIEAMVRQDKGKEVEQALIGYHIALDKACTELAPQHMVQHLLSLARAFNSLYAQEQFIDETNKEKTAYYLMLTHGVQTILAHGLTTLGIEAPEVM